VPIDVDLLVSEVDDPLDAVLGAALDPAAAAGFTEFELLLLHPATTATRAVAPATPRPSFPVPIADICYLASRWNGR
jgi:hypothetical protein